LKRSSRRGNKPQVYTKPDGNVDYKLAELLGVSQGHYSKLKVKIEEKMRAGRKKWRAANGLPEFDEPCLECNQNYPAHRHFYGDEND
jgi:hypothetical protein